MEKEENQKLIDLVKHVQKLEKQYESKKKKMTALPKGTIFVRKMGDQYYAYRKYREGNKVISKYIGPIKNEEVKQVMKEVEEYKKLNFSVKSLKKQLDSARKDIVRKNKENDDIMAFAESVSTVDSRPASKAANKIIRMFLDGYIDSETTEKMIIGLYK